MNHMWMMAWTAMRRVWGGMVISLILALPYPLTAQAEPTTGIGTVLVRVGDAFYQAHEEDTWHRLTERATVHEQWRIRTAAGAMVQIRTVDDAYLTIRARSQVRFEVYRFDAAHPERTRIRIQVERGDVWWVSGRGAKANRQGFRLNTPVAAIGIRGTSFATRVLSDELTRVRLFSGIVVASPFGAGCSPSAFGPCASPLARTLDERHRQFILEIRPTSAPVMLPVERWMQKSELSRQREGEYGVDTVSDLIDTRVPRALFWGKYDQEQVLPETIEHVSHWLESGAEPVVSNRTFALFRRPVEAAPLPEGGGEVHMTLSDAVAGHVLGKYHYVPIDVLDGQLVLDFDRARFNTSLALLPERSDTPETYRAAGRLHADGLFFGKGDMSVNGAVADKGRQAGYVFSVPLKDGTRIDGATFWSAP